jgi:hypothetical protein
MFLYMAVIGATGLKEVKFLADPGVIVPAVVAAAGQ